LAGLESCHTNFFAYLTMVMFQREGWFI
jgi:hypothetical protein